MSQNPLGPPPPSQDAPLSKWLYMLWRRLTDAGQILWATVDKTGSNLTDIATRNHNDLQNIAGGAANDYSHLTAAQLTDLTDGGDSTLHYHAADRALGNATGTLAIGNGGTGQTTANAALNALLPAQAANSGKALITNGTDAAWTAITSGTVTSVALTMPTGFSVAGSPVTSSGTLAVTTTLNGILKGDGLGAITTATSGTDYEGVIAAGTTSQYWRGDKSWQTLDKSAVGLGNVENTALSTWAGSANISTLGTITTGTWSGTAIAANKMTVMVGDSGAGGTQGAVPAPAAGDASAGKYLKADGTWSAPTGGSSGADIYAFAAAQG